MELISIDADGAENIKKAFQDYYDRIDNKLKLIKNLDIETYLSAFKAEQAENVRTYVGEIIDAMHTIDEPLTEFRDAIDTVIKNYGSQSANYKASDVNVDPISGAGDLTGVASFGEGESRIN